ncbi:MAG: hypothetical protein K2Q22_00530 [Cytophagales bacterium]|nr:hypothetical protein [Cytophagales bacterium]
MAQNSISKPLWSKSESFSAKMTYSDKDDIHFSLYDKNMNVLKADSLRGDCSIKFPHEIDIPLTIKKVDDHTLVATLKDFNGYIKFIQCELYVQYRQTKLSFIFTNK